MVYHVVLVKFKPGQDASWQPLMAALAKLKSILPGMTSLSGGANMSPEGLNQGFTHGFVMTFTDAAARDAYLIHPDHEKVKSDFLPLIENVLVFDFAA